MEGIDTDGLNAGQRTTIRTFTGLNVDPLFLYPEDVVIEDIAHALARQCRYNGHCVGFLSVARHSIEVSLHLYYQGMNLKIQFAGLLHDAAEAYLGDVPRPLKYNPEFGTMYAEAERRAEAVIFPRFGLEPELPAAVVAGDKFVLTERELGGHSPMREGYYGSYEDDEAEFLARFFELRTRLEHP